MSTSVHVSDPQDTATSQNVVTSGLTHSDVSYSFLPSLLPADSSSAKDDNGTVTSLSVTSVTSYVGKQPDVTFTTADASQGDFYNTSLNLLESETSPVSTGDPHNTVYGPDLSTIQFNPDTSSTPGFRSGLSSIQLIPTIAVATAGSFVVLTLIIAMGIHCYR